MRESALGPGWVGLALFFAASSANAAVELGADLMFSGISGPVNEVSIRSRAGLLVGGAVAAGLVAYYEPMHSYLTDIILGGGMRFGSKFFVEIDGGYLQRKFDGVTGRGFAAVVMPGYHFTPRVRVSTAIYVKRLQGGDLPSRWIGDIFPFFGVRLSL